MYRTVTRQLVVTGRLLMLITSLIVVDHVAAADDVSIRFDGKVVIASVKKGASAAWLGVSLEIHGDGLRLFKRAFIVDDDDHDGEIHVTLSRDVPRKSLWMVVDLKSGEYAINAPSGDILLTRKAVAEEFLHSRSDDAAARLFHAHPFSTALLVRPGVGAWIAHVRDGSPEDGDGVTNGKTEAILEKMVSVGNSPGPPDDLERDDVIALLDPLTLRIMDGRVIK